MNSKFVSLATTIGISAAMKLTGGPHTSTTNTSNYAGANWFGFLSDLTGTNGYAEGTANYDTYFG